MHTFWCFIGKPKGVILSHENVVACASACVQQLGIDGHAPNKSDVMISYLPMAHMLERICQVYSHCCDISIASIEFNFKDWTEC